MNHSTLHPLLALPLAVGCVSTGPELDPRIPTLEAFLEAKAAGDLEGARAYLVPEPRIWYEERSGAGSLWSLEGGRWQGWDEHFRGESRRVSPWQLEQDRVWADMLETNDYYRLVGRAGRTWRASYFFDGEGRLEGLLIAGLPNASPTADLGDAFREWARRHDPDELDELMPGGQIDPTGDHPPRMRALLERWRRARGLGPQVL